MFTLATLSNPFSPNQLGRYNNLRFFSGSNPNSQIFIRPLGDLDNDGYEDLIIKSGEDSYVAYGYAPGVSLRHLPETSSGFTPYFPDSVPIYLGLPSPRILYNNKPFFEKYDDTTLSFAIGQDINGDGLKELFVSNKNLPIERRNYVLFGKPGGFKVSDISADPGILDGKKGFYHPPINDEKVSITFNGDVNGDGITDLSINDFIFFGTRDAFPGVLNSDILDGKNGFQVKNGTSTVFSIRNLGDINGDGRSDLNLGRSILFSPKSFSPTIDVSLPTLGLTTEITPKELLAEIRPLGDVNRDGIDDFAFVQIHPWSSTSGSRTHLFYGKNQPFNPQINALTEADVSLDYGVHNASDFNNDGFIDLLMSFSAPPGGRFAGASTTYIAFGGVNGWSTPEKIGGERDTSGAKNIGDFNGDGIDDIYTDNKIIFGGRVIRELRDDEVDGKNGIIIGRGFRPAGDVNGDGRTDLTKDNFVILGTNRINNKDTIVFKSFGGPYNHFEFPDNLFTNADALSFTASANRSDWVYGGWGNDTLTGRSGQMDQFTGGPGNDQFVLNNEYGLQIGKGFAVVWDFDKGIDKVVVHGTANDYFFVEDNNTWLDNKNATFLRHRTTDTSGIVNTILARRSNSEFGAVMIAAFSDVKLDISDLVFVPNTTVV